MVSLSHPHPPSIEYSHKPLIPSINTIPQQLLHKINKSLLPAAHLRHVKREDLLKLLRRMILYEGGPGTAARDGETMARVLGCRVLVGGADEGND
jgi:hypothetical protein